MLSLLHYHVFIGTAKLVLSYVFGGFVWCFFVSAFLQLNCLILEVVATQSAAEITKSAHNNNIRQNLKKITLYFDFTAGSEKDIEKA